MARLEIWKSYSWTDFSQKKPYSYKKRKLLFSLLKTLPLLPIQISNESIGKHVEYNESTRPSGIRFQKKFLRQAGPALAIGDVNGDG